MSAPTRSGTSRLRAAGLAALVCALAVPAVLSHAQTTSSTCAQAGQFRRINVGRTQWTEIKEPTFPNAPAAITAYAVAPWDPEVIYATNGKSVVQSGSGGCTWQTVLTLTQDGGGDVALSSATTTITSIVMPENRSATYQVYLTAVQLGEGIGRPYVLFSQAGQRNTFQVRSTGLPPAGRPIELAIAPSNPSTLYLALRSVPGLPIGTPTIPGTPVQTTTSGAVYKSTDGGGSWSRASDGNDFDGAPAVDDIAVDSRQATRLWTVAGGQLRVSTNSGATHAPPTNLGESRQAPYDFTAVDVFNSRVVAFSRTGSNRPGPSAMVSTDSGASFAERGAPGVVTSTAHIDQSRQLVIGTTGSSGGEIYRYGTDGSSQRITPTAGTDWDVQADRAGNAVFGMRAEALYKTTRDPSKPPLPPDGITGGGVGKVPPVVATIKPKKVEISLGPGETTTRDFEITLPPSPTQLDVFLIIDNSKSMINLIAGVKRDLAAVLQRLVSVEKIDVHAGLAYYGTTEDPPLYVRLADIQSPNTRKVYDAMAELKADNTGSSEPVLLALEQAATGKGFNKTYGVPLSTCAVEIEPVETALCGIPPNQDASWRAKSLRVFVHATNERFLTQLDDVDDRDEPTFDEAAKALRDRQIQHIGIAVSPEASPHLKQMSRLVGTLSPVGVDCDGDGRKDIKAGDPIVCPPGNNLAQTLVEVLRAVRDVQPVGIFTRAESPVFKGITLPNSTPIPAPQVEFRAVNVKKINTLRYKATFSCVNVAPSSTPYEVKLSAQLRGETLRGADATALVTCGALVAGVPQPPGPDPGTPPGPQPQVQPQPLPAQPAPAVPVLQIQPAPQVQVNPQVNPQAGAARQEDKEFQFATATNDVLQDEREGQTQLAMSALAGVALIGAFGTAHAMRRREADRLAYVRNR
jgi:hypothetical protein